LLVKFGTHESLCSLLWKNEAGDTGSVLVPLDLVASALSIADRGLSTGIASMMIRVMEKKVPDEAGNMLIDDSIVLSLKQTWVYNPVAPYKANPIPDELIESTKSVPEFEHAAATHEVPALVTSLVNFNIVHEYITKRGVVPANSKEDLNHVLEVLDMLDLINNINFPTSMEALLAVFVQPVVDKFHAMPSEFDREQGAQLMAFAYWILQYRLDQDGLPNILEQFSEESLKKSDLYGQSYSECCARFEMKFKLGPPPLTLAETAEFYVSSIDRLEMSPALASLFINVAQYKAEKDSSPNLCLWSQPVVNHRGFDHLRVEKLRTSFIYDAKYNRGLSHEDYVCFPYVIVNEKDGINTMPVKPMVKEAELKESFRAEALSSNLKEALLFYKFVFGNDYKDSLAEVGSSKRVEQDEAYMAFGAFNLFASAIHGMNLKYKGLSSIESLRKLYRDLLQHLFSCGTDLPDQAMNLLCEDYAQLFHACRIAYQAAFKFRLGIIDGAHRIMTALAAIYNVNPKLGHSGPVAFLQTEELWLSRLCHKAYFKMSWPNCHVYNSVVSFLQYQLLCSFHRKLSLRFRPAGRNRKS
jgi:hypothetical protein